jgi:hypothetical protein
MEDPTKSPFDNPQLATGGSYLRMPDKSLLKVEGHDVTEKQQAERVKIRDAALADAKVNHEARIAAAAKGGAEGGNAEAAQASSGPAGSPASAASEVTADGDGSTSKSTARRSGGRTGETTGE